MFTRAKTHGLLMTLPAIQDNVTITRETKRESDGFASIRDSPECFSFVSSLGPFDTPFGRRAVPRACRHFLKDSIQRLGARVFSSQHCEISQFCRCFCHHAAFGLVA